MKKSMLTNGNLINACQKWIEQANTESIATATTENNPIVLFSELLERCRPMLTGAQKRETKIVPITNEGHKRCYDLLCNVFIAHCNNEIHLDSLHEMFLSYCKDYRRTDELHTTIVETYECLHGLLKDSGKVFEPEWQERLNNTA